VTGNMLSSAEQVAAAKAELCTLTGMSPDELSDFVNSSPVTQRVILAGYRNANWTQMPTILSRVVAILTALAPLLPLVEGIGGVLSAAEEVKALFAT